MSLDLFYLHFSQGERIVFLCEELSLRDTSFKYNLHVFPRGLEQSLGSKTLFSIFPTGTSPMIVDSTVDPPVKMSESQAILTYILEVHGKGFLQVAPPGSPPGRGRAAATVHEYARYQFWLSFANGSLQGFLNADIYAHTIFSQVKMDEESLKEFKLGPAHLSYQARKPTHLKLMESRLTESKFLAGEEFSAADVMCMFTFTLFRLIFPMDLGPYPNLLRWLKDVTSRKGYRNAMDKAEDGLPALTGATVPYAGWEVLLSAAPWHSVPELKKLKDEQEKVDAAK